MTTTNWEHIKLLVLDVDGVLTDGGIAFTANGDEFKTFNTKDGAGLKYWQRAGGTVAWITGRMSALVERRAAELGVTLLHQDIKTKLPVFEEVCRTAGATPAETAVVGDDLPDLPMLQAAGFAACPADAVEEVRRCADYVCQLPGGRGCVREVIEYLLKSSGRWSTILSRYQDNREGSSS